MGTQRGTHASWREQRGSESCAWAPRPSLVIPCRSRREDGAAGLLITQVPTIGLIPSRPRRLRWCGVASAGVVLRLNGRKPPAKRRPPVKADAIDATPHMAKIRVRASGGFFTSASMNE